MREGHTEPGTDPTASAPGFPAAAAVAGALTLAVVAGCVDAVGLSRLYGVFTANQSGNVVLVGLGIGEGEPVRAWRSLAAIVGFAVGTGLGIVLIRRVSTRFRPALLLGLETAILLAVAVGVHAVEPAHRPLPSPQGGFLLAATAVAMGLQTQVIRKVSGISVSTTYESGAVGQVGEALAEVRVGSAGGPGPGRTAAVVGGIVVAYAGGAAVGGWTGGHAVEVLLAAAAATVVIAVGLELALAARRR